MAIMDKKKKSKVAVHPHAAYIPEPLYKRLKVLSNLRIASINAMIVEGLYLVAKKKEDTYLKVASEPEVPSEKSDV